MTKKIALGKTNKAPCQIALFISKTAILKYFVSYKLVFVCNIKEGSQNFVQL